VDGAEGADGAPSSITRKREKRAKPRTGFINPLLHKEHRPLEAAKLNVTDYLDNGVYDGPAICPCNTLSSLQHNRLPAFV